MPKSPDAFRTISEVADWLGVQAHVLRFWESKFAQVKPIKRAGGRRYYRPADMLLLGGIKKLLHDDGLTIKGTQKLLRENGVAYVADLSQPLDDLTMAVIEGDAQEAALDAPEAKATTGWENAESPEPAGDEPPPDAPDLTDVDPSNAPQDIPTPLVADAAAGADDAADSASEEPDAEPEDNTAAEPAGDATVAPQPEESPAPEQIASQQDDAEDAWLQKGEDADPKAEPDSPPKDTAAEEIDEEAALHTPLPSFRARHRAQDVPADPDGPPQDPHPDPEEARPEEAQELAQTSATPRQVDVPAVPALSEIVVQPALLSTLSRIRKLTPEHAREIKPHLARLTRLRASMANALKDTHKD